MAMAIKKKWIGILAAAMAFVLCLTLGIVFSLDTKKVSAAETITEGCVAEYDVLYTDDFTVYDYKNSKAVENNGTYTIAPNTFLNFTPSANNTTGSFVWKSKFTYTTENSNNHISVYPLASGNWGSNAAFYFDELDYFRFTNGQIYDLEFGVLKLDDGSENYRVYVAVDGEVQFSRDTWKITHNQTACPCGGSDVTKHTGIYFANSGTGVFSSQRPAVVVDRLTNSDWKLGGKKGEIVPTEWEIPATEADYGAYIDFNASNENTTASFIWEFDFLCMLGGKSVNVFPFAGATWPGTSYVDIATAYSTSGFTAGEIYKIKIGVVSTNARLNDKYDFYVSIDDRMIYETTLDAAEKVGEKRGDGLYLIFNNKGAKGILVGEERAETEAPAEPTDPNAPSIDLSAYVDTYDVLNNQDWTIYSGNTSQGTMGETWDMTGGYCIEYSPSAENTTGSFVWKFTYTHVTDDNINIYGFGGKSWANTGNTYIYYHNCFDAGKTYDVELCLLKLKDSTFYELFVVVDGVKVTNGTAVTRTIDESLWNGYNSLYISGAGKGTCYKPMSYDAYVDTYDVLYNSDWTIYNGETNASEGKMGNDWKVIDNKLIDFTPSESNTTGSFIWKFKYTPTAGAKTGANLYPLSSYAWSSECCVDFNTLGLASGTTYDIEFGVLRLLNSADYYMYVKVGGSIEWDDTAAPAHSTATVNNPCTYYGCKDEACRKHKGIYFYIADTTYAATCSQGGLSVEINGDKQTVESGTTVLDAIGVSGLLPADRPSGYTTTWYDDKGNKVTAATQITDNVTLTPTYTYDYTILGVDGKTLHNDKHVYGSEASYDGDVLTVDRTTFVGYLVGDSLYQNLVDAINASAESGKDIVAKTVTVGLVDGASIRVDGAPSIRFTATIDKSEADGATIVNYGMLLTTKATLDKITDFTIYGLSGVDASLYHNRDKANGMRCVENSDYPNQYVYSLILNEVSLGNYGVQYVARAYAVVQYADGTQEIIYSEFDKEAHTRSMYEVASAAITDANHGYTDKQKAVIQKHIDGVIDLADTFSIQGRDRSYTVAVSGPTDGTYTITVTAMNSFDLSGIGAIYVGGEKLPVYNANLSAGTFQIKEEDMSVITLNRFNEFLSAYTANRELLINAYSGPSLSLKAVNATESIPSGWVNGGYDFTLADLETYMAAGFDAWRLEISPYTTELGYVAEGKTYDKDIATRDIYMALDLAAQYAEKHGKACKVYVNIPEVTGLETDAEKFNKIKPIYDILTNYDDGISGKNGVPSPVNGKNQIAGFLLKDEPYMSDKENFETIFNHLHNECGAGAAGYDYQIALLPSYSTSSNYGKDYANYVKTYADILKDAKTIGFDNYPFEKSWGSASFDNSWYSDMETNRAQTNGYGTCIQSYTSGSDSNKCIQYETEISMQVYVALAYGFTNLDYFTYGDRVDHEVSNSELRYDNVALAWKDYSDWSQGYTLNDMYTWIQNANKEAHSLYEVLGKFTNNGVQLITGSTSNGVFDSATTTNTTNAIVVTSTYDMVVGGFTCGEQNGYLAVNADLPTEGNRTTRATFSLSGYNKAIVYVNGKARVERITNGSLTLNIDAGEGVFIVPLS